MAKIKSDFFEFLLSYGVNVDDIDVIFDNIDYYENGLMLIDTELSSDATDALWAYNKINGGAAILEY